MINFLKDAVKTHYFRQFKAENNKNFSQYIIIK